MISVLHHLGTFALNILWQLAVFAMVLALCDFFLRRASSAWRAAFWTGGLLIAAVLPWLPASQLRSDGRRTAPIVIQTTATSAVSSRTLLIWPGAFLAALALWRAGRLGHGLLRLQRLRRSSAVSAEGIHLSEGVGAPVTFGWRRPVILVPEKFWQEASLEVKQSVLAHERAHIDRKDYAWNLALECLSIMAWWHPAVIWMKRRTAALREYACDERAAAEVANYARSMVTAAQILADRRTPQAALGFFDSNNLEERVMKLTQPFARIPFRWAMLSLAGASTILLATAWLLVAHPVALAEEPAKIYKIADGVKAPRLLSKIEPEYTEEARDAKVSGTAVLKIVVAADGEVQKAEITQSLDPGLDANAIDAVTRWKFEPATLDGKPVAVSATVEVNFRLE